MCITLCVSERNPQTYTECFSAGARRNLLRIETSSSKLFAMLLNPENQQHERRIDCLRTLKSIDYQVGVCVLIGLPRRGIDDLIEDFLFFRAMDADMIGMGPYIPHGQAPLRDESKVPSAETRLHLGLPHANVIMPQVTPLHVWGTYSLYDGKLIDSVESYTTSLEQQMAFIGRRIDWNGWGDSAHFAQRACSAGPKQNPHGLPCGFSANLKDN